MFSRSSVVKANVQLLLVRLFTGDDRNGIRWKLLSCSSKSGIYLHTSPWTSKSRTL